MPLTRSWAKRRARCFRRRRYATWALANGLSLAPGSVADDLGHACGSEVPGRRQAAATVMAETGHRLAWVLATLHAPGTAADQGSSPWREDYLRH